MDGASFYPGARGYDGPPPHAGIMLLGRDFGTKTTIEDEYFSDQERMERDIEEGLNDGMSGEPPPERRRSPAYHEGRKLGQEEGRLYNRFLDWELESE
jgi:hypothetical protein